MLVGVLRPKRLFGRVHVALPLRDRKTELPNNVGEAFGSPVAERQDYMGRSPIDVSPPAFGEPGGVSPRTRRCSAESGG